MKRLFDQNISFRIIKNIEPIFNGSEQVRRLGLENSSDREIWLYAKKNGFTIVTLDSDFYDLSLLNGQPPKVVWIRHQNLTSEKMSNILTHQAPQIKAFINDDSLSCLQIEG